MRVEAAGICIFPFDLPDLNKASSHSVKGVKVTMSCSPARACSRLPPPSIVALILATERHESRIKGKHDRGSPKELVYALHTHMHNLHLGVKPATVCCFHITVPGSHVSLTVEKTDRKPFCLNNEA